MTLTTIIINFNSWKDTLTAVRSLNKSLVPKGWTRKIIVVENGSTQQGNWRGLQPLQSLPNVRLIKLSHNQGFTGGNNAAISEAKKTSDYILLLNPDTTVDRTFLPRLLEPFQHDPNIGIASPKIYFYPGYETLTYSPKQLGHVIWYGGGAIDWKNVYGYHLHVDEVDNTMIDSQSAKLTDFATGCCMLIKKAVFEKIGKLDNHFFLNLEDLDFSLRARNTGFKVVYVPASHIWHKNAVTKGGSGSKLEDYYQTRNRLLFAFKYCQPRTWALLTASFLHHPSSTRILAIFSAFRLLLAVLFARILTERFIIKD